MKVLIIGGTRFIGPFVARRLCEMGHEVAVFHRGEQESTVLPEVEHIHSGVGPSDPHDRRRLAEHREQFRRFGPEVVVDMIAFTREDAKALVRTFQGIAPRTVVPSSEDVYRAYGRLHRTEPGPPDQTPLTEDSPLREQLSIHREEYEKRWVEQVVMGEPELAGTVLRLPAVYGPGDHRLYEWTKRMLDGRPAILLEERYAAWRWTYGYVEDVAEAIVLAATQERAAGRIYNVGEAIRPTTLERARAVGRAAGWAGEVLAVPADRLPPHLVRDLDWSQDWVVDSSRIREELGYREVVAYEEGLRRMVDWHRKHPPKEVDPKQFDYGAEDAVLAGLRDAGTE
jgi:nucleoside-diphosphate-sugar epimerase